MPIGLNKLEHLVAVADCASFSAAAQRLNLTQPALSRSVAESERRMGLKIFDRGRAGATPTADGTTLVNKARALLAHANDFDHSVGQFSRGDRGMVRFAMAPVVASIVMAPLTSSMLQDYPNIDLIPAIMAPADALGALETGKIDVALLPLEASAAVAGCQITPLLDLDISAIVRSSHPLTEHKCGMPEVFGYKVVLGSEINLPPGNAGMIVCNDTQIVSRMVLDTDLVWITSPIVIGHLLAEGRLTSLFSLPIALRAAMVHKHQVSPAVATFLARSRALLDQATVQLRGSSLD